jgi:hypothetical protein
VNQEIAAQRLYNQRIAPGGLRTPVDVVAWFGAVQAQDYAGAKWAVGLRMRKTTTDVEIESAFDDGEILRTHVMRPTWHFVTRSDIYWILELTAARVHQALRYANRSYELDRATSVRATTVFERELRDGLSLTRTELGARLAKAGIAAKGVRLALLTVYAELEGVLCSGPHRGKELTYSLLAVRAPQPRRLLRDEALAELTLRYFISHGPATIRDFVWWSGLTTADARRGLEINKAQHAIVDGLTYWTIGEAPATRRRNESIHLLPVFDEYIVAYRDLAAVPRTAIPRGTLPPAVIVSGQIAGTWKAVRKPEGLIIGVSMPRAVGSEEKRTLAEAVRRYGKFLGQTCVLQAG